MNRRWILASLPVLLGVGVLAGWALDRPLPRSSAPDRGTSEPVQEQKLPRFDCEDLDADPYQPDPQTRQRHLDWMDENLDLSSEQLVSLAAVFDNASFRADEFWRSTRDRYCELREIMHADIRSLLEEEQARHLDRLIEEYRQEKEERRQKTGTGSADAPPLSEFGTI